MDAKTLTRRKLLAENVLMANPITGPAYSLYKAQDIDRNLFGPGPRGAAVMLAKTAQGLGNAALTNRLSIPNIMAATETGVNRGAMATKRNYQPQGFVENAASMIGENFTPLNVALANPEGVAEALAKRAAQARAINYAMGEAGTFGGVGAKHFPEYEGQFSMLTDKKPRFEIDDSLSSFNVDAIKGIPGSQTRGAVDNLGNIFQHETLYEQYPEMKNIPVALDIHPNQSKPGGSFNPQTNEIKIKARNLEEGKSLLMHEVQHAIQEKEGFARGGSPETVGSILEAKIKDLRKMENDAYQSGNRQLQLNLENQRRKLEDEYSLAKWSPFSDYERLAGEIESRDVQSRINMGPRIRSAMQPLASQNIPLNKMIITDKSGAVANALKNRRIKYGQ